jgi:hypothetical protein
MVNVPFERINSNNKRLGQVLLTSAVLTFLRGYPT